MEGGVFAQADYSSYAEVVFNELEAGCFPLTGADEWLINQTALLSSWPPRPLTFSPLPHLQPALHIPLRKWS